MPQNYNTNTKYYNPYNYSPLSKRVFTPSWRNLISQDIPFSDGVSGSIDVTFEALTPLIVKEGKEGQLSVNLNGEYFIPGTSIKGMVRNVLEIISLSKMGPLVKDNRYSLRDLDGANNDYTLKRRPNDVKAGLMVKINDSFFLIECPDFEKLSYEDIAEFKEVQPKELWDAKSVELKYELVNNEPFYDFNSDRYVLFFTGKMQNKEHEYGIKIPTSLVFKPLEKAVVKDFLFVHEHEVKSKSWSFWKKKIKNFKKKPTYKDLTTDLNFAPVFYTKNNENEIESLGLAFLHRELYKHSVHYFLGKDHTSNDLDLAQCIFGSSEHDFKGRVQFAPAFVDMHGKQVNNIPTEIILGTPKPTFYPFYLTQVAFSIL